MDLSRILNPSSPKPQETPDEAYLRHVSTEAPGPSVTNNELQHAGAGAEDADARRAISAAQEKGMRRRLSGDSLPGSSKRQRLDEDVEASSSPVASPQGESMSNAPTGLQSLQIKLGTPIPESPRQTSADISGPSTVAKGKQKATSVSSQSSRASMTAQGRGAQNRLSRSLSATAADAGNFGAKASDRFTRSPSASVQDGAAALMALAGLHPTVGARKASTTAQSSIAPPISEPGAGAVQEAIESEQASQGGSNIPDCYRNMDEWIAGIRNMIARRKELGLRGFEPGQKVAMVELIEANSMGTAEFMREMNLTLHKTVTNIINNVKEMRKAGTVPAPWRPPSEAAPDIPECYGNDMNAWMRAIKTMVDDKRDAHTSFFTDDQKHALTELFYASGLTKTAFQREVLSQGGTSTITNILEAVERMRAGGSLPAPWRPSQTAMPGPSTARSAHEQ